MFGGTISEDPRLQLAMNRCPVYFLNGAADFSAWMVALQRLVTGANMSDALLYSLPTSEVEQFERGHPVTHGNPEVTQEARKLEGKAAKELAEAQAEAAKVKAAKSADVERQSRAELMGFQDEPPE